MSRLLLLMALVMLSIAACAVIEAVQANHDVAFDLSPAERAQVEELFRRSYREHARYCAFPPSTVASKVCWARRGRR